MEITWIVVICIAAALLSLYLRQQRPEYAMLVSLACGVLVLLLLLGQVKDITVELRELTGILGQDQDLISIVLKCLGICILAELGSQCCRDAGETALATKVELSAKVMLVLVSVPLLQELLKMVRHLVDI